LLMSSAAKYLTRTRRPQYKQSPTRCQVASSQNQLSRACYQKKLCLVQSTGKNIEKTCKGRKLLKARWIPLNHSIVTNFLIVYNYTFFIMRVNNVSKRAPPNRIHWIKVFLIKEVVSPSSPILEKILLSYSTSWTM
jgi:hypothetical protein